MIVVDASAVIAFFLFREETGNLVLYMKQTISVDRVTKSSTMPFGKQLT